MRYTITVTYTDATTYVDDFTESLARATEDLERAVVKKQADKRARRTKCRTHRTVDCRNVTCRTT